MKPTKTPKSSRQAKGSQRSALSPVMAALQRVIERLRAVMGGKQPSANK